MLLNNNNISSIINIDMEVFTFNTKDSLGVYELSSLFALFKHIDKETNFLVDNNRILNRKDLYDIFPCSTNKADVVILNLSSTNILLPLKYGRENIYMINPYIFRTSQEISEISSLIMKNISDKNKLQNILDELLIKEKRNSNTKNAFKNKISIAKDGAKCLSKAELAIHNYLLDKNIDNLNKEVLYKDFISNNQLLSLCKNTRCDWTFEYRNKFYIVEYFGLMTNNEYLEKHDAKKSIIKLDGKTDCFISIYPKDIHNLDSIFNFIA